MLPTPARRLVVLLAALTALVVAGCAGVSATPGAGGLGLQTRVGAFIPVAQPFTGQLGLESPCLHQGSASSIARSAAGFCVAAQDRAGDLSAAARARAEELQGQLPAGSQGRVTMAVGMGRDAEGNVQTIVGTSEPGGYLRPGVTLNPGEVVATAAGHAEVSIINEFGPFTDPFYIAAGRPICPICAAAIEESGATPASPLK
jgi:filamentous hemagglutinin